MQRRLRRMLPLTMAWVMAFSSVGTVAYGAEPDVQIQEEAEGNPGLELQDTAIQEEQQVMPEEIQETGDEEPGQVQDSQQEPGNEPGQETGGAEPDAVSQDQISQDQIFQNEPDIASEENRDALMEGNARQEVRAVEADRSWYKPNETTFTINTAAQLAGLAEIVNGYPHLV